MKKAHESLQQKLIEHVKKQPEHRKLAMMKVFKQLQERQRREGNRMRELMRRLSDPTIMNPEGLQYRPTPGDLEIIERQKRSEERRESGWWGGYGNN